MSTNDKTLNESSISEKNLTMAPSDKFVLQDWKLEIAVDKDGNGSMVNSGYHNKPDEYMYFKVGIYNVNNSGDKGDYSQATFYKIKKRHQG